MILFGSDSITWTSSIQKFSYPHELSLVTKDSNSAINVNKQKCRLYPHMQEQDKKTTEKDSIHLPLLDVLFSFKSLYKYLSDGLCEELFNDLLILFQKYELKRLTNLFEFHQLSSHFNSTIKGIKSITEMEEKESRIARTKNLSKLKKLFIDRDISNPYHPLYNHLDNPLVRAIPTKIYNKGVNKK